MQEWIDARQVKTKQVGAFLRSLCALWPDDTYRNIAMVDSSSLESSALMHTLAVIAELMGIAVQETRDVQLHETLQHPPTALSSERTMLLAQSITAVLRRALPALRIASMWLLSNADYLSKFDSTSATFKSDDPSVPPAICSAIRGFWTNYATFANALAKAFPMQYLPVTASDLMLEEDIDMMGFAPLRRRMKDASVGKVARGVSAALSAAPVSNSTLHPNEEQVLRLGDLLGDANLLATSESCPIILEGACFIIRRKRLNPATQPWNPIKISPASAEDEMAVISLDREVEEDEDTDEIDPEGEDETEGTYEGTEDDVLDLAMRVATGNTGLPGPEEEVDTEDDDDEVLYPSRVVPSAVQ